MDKVFDEIFGELQNIMEKNMEYSKNGIVTSSGDVAISGTSGDIEFDFKLDKNGFYQYKTSKYGAGMNVHLNGIITAPDSEFSITVSSNDGGGGSWDHIKTNQNIQCTIKTSFWHNTDVTVTIHSDLTDCDGHAKIHYSI